MKTMTVRLPENFAAEIEAEARQRKVSKSEIIRERLNLARARPRRPIASLDTIGDLIGSVDGLRADLSARKKKYLKALRFGQKRSPALIVHRRKPHRSA